MTNPPSARQDAGPDARTHDRHDDAAPAVSTMADDAATLPQRYTAQLADRIETTWQSAWAREQTFRARNPGDADFDPRQPKFYCLDMFPYPSGAGLHVGHPVGYTATDIICRYRRHQGYNVLHPMGWDAFGLPAEQYAIQTGVHPAVTTRRAIDTFRRQLQRFGFSYDWQREFGTIDPGYYRWTQWIWLEAYHAWYDRARDRARPIADLEAEFRAGTREIRVNPDAAEHAPAVKAQRFDRWDDLDAGTRRLVIDSWRLVYLAEQTVNWCPKLGTALANEEVIDGRSERGGHPVLRKPLRQWMYRITAYADRLLRDLEGLDWPESTRTMQREWIGRSEGAEIDFAIDTSRGTLPAGAPDRLRVFTTRPDTIFGATYMVVAPEHPLVDALLSHADSAGAPPAFERLRAYVTRSRNRADVDRIAETKEKTGEPTGLFALNPATGERIPIQVADYVLMGYGHGAIMAVPAHDQRDFDFAMASGLPVRAVVLPPDDWLAAHAPAGVAADAASRRDRFAADPGAFGGGIFAGDGTVINSAGADVSLNGLATADAKAQVIAWLERTGLGTRRVNYRLRDWLFSRQRYWGEPFPVVFDEAGDHHPVSPGALPVTLPEMTDYQPVESDEPLPLLGKATEWVHTTARHAGVDPSVLPPDAKVRRETNTMPGWAGSCWYYLRYLDPANGDRFVGRDAERYWMVSRRRSAAAPGEAPAVGEPWSPDRHHAGGVDLYVGGSEHAVLHLLYARFWHKILFDLGHVSTPEPFGRLFHQGLLTSFAYQRSDRSLVAIDAVTEHEPGVFVETATGERVTQTTAKMSKSLRNIVNPDDIIRGYGADTFRLYEMYLGPLEASKPWNTQDIVGPFRFLQRFWRLAVDERTGALSFRDEPSADLERLLHRTVARVGADIDRLSLHTAIAALIEFVNEAVRSGGITRDQYQRLVIVLSPFAPHMAEELWARLGHSTSIARAPWPTVDPAMLEDAVIELPIQVLGRVRGRIEVPKGADAAEIERLVLAHPRVAEILDGKPPRKVIVVPGRIVNLIPG